MAPTGSGKTLAACLSSIDALIQSPARGCRVVYVSPLRALAVDVERNLRSPIAGIGHAAERLGLAVREPTVAIRTGDTPAKDRARFSKTPADIFITTPESLYLVLSSSAGEALRDVETVIVDEIHAIVSTKRGAHLALSLERLERLAGRRLAERIANAVNDLAGEELAHAHHGSIAREQRLRIEDDLKAGRLRALVATSTLELGIDMGAIDLVVQVESPPSVASGMQRIGRAGHRVDEPSTGIILPKYRGDLLASAALTERMHAGAVEASRYIRNPLDVLAQHIVAIVGRDPIGVDELERLIHGSAPFAELPRAQLENVLDMLSGRYPSDEFAELRPRIVWDRIAGTIRAREGAARVALTSGGTIPDRGPYRGFLVGGEPGKGRVGAPDV